MANVASPFILFPWATVGDVQAGGIPQTGTDVSAASYQYGFSQPYEYPTTNPNYLPVPRSTFNQLMLDITTAIQQFQWQGIPAWISVGAGGPSTGYLLYSQVIYAGTVWISQINNNTSTPGSDNNWVPFNNQGVPIGGVIDFPTFIAPVNYLPAIGQLASRTTYATLFAAQCPILLCNTTASTLVTVTSSNGTVGMFPGMAIEATGLAGGVPYAIITAINNSTQFTLDTAFTGTNTGLSVQFFSWVGGVGTSNFQIPFLNNRATVGFDPTMAGLPAESGANVYAPGQLTGTAARQIVANNLPGHTHSGSATTTLTGTTYDKTGSSSTNLITGSQGNPHTGIPNVTATTTVTVGSNTTTNTAFDIVQPSAVMYKMIRYI